MNELNRVLLILHFVGLAMGFSVSFANMVMGGLIARAAPAEKPVLGRFPPKMSRLGDIGMVLLWGTGITLVFTRYSGLSGMPWTFHAKLGAVALLTVTVQYIHRLERRARTGDTTVQRRMEAAGKLAMVLALLAVVLAVVTFD